MSLVDSHCHLDQLKDPEAVLAEAGAAGVDRIVAVAQDAASMAAVLDLARRFPGRVLAALGLHPVCVVERPRHELEAAMATLAARLGEAAEVGETGLDHKAAVTPEQRALQEHFLERHFELAARFARPVNLHSRRCPRQVMERAAAFHRDSGLHAQLHWFTHSARLAHTCNDEGLFVSVGPSILHDPQAAAVACEVAADLLLLETDAPVPIGGVAGHPRRVREVAGKLALLRGVEEPDLAARTAANFARFLAGPGPRDGSTAPQP